MALSKVLWINEEPRMVGGAERYIADTVRGLRERGIRSSLLHAGDPAGLADEFAELFEESQRIDDFDRQVKALNPDIVYLHRFAGTAILGQLAKSGVSAARFFHDYHTFCLRKHKFTGVRHHTCTKPIGFRCYPCMGFVSRADNSVGLSFHRVGELRREHRAHNFLDAYIAGSKSMAEHIADHGFDRGKIHTIPLYARPPVETPPVQREKDLLVFAAQLLRGKGLDHLLAALAMTRLRPRLIVVGGGKQESMFRAQCHELGLDDRVEWAGLLPNREIATYYQRATAVVVPSRQLETFALVGPEAMSYGAPVIAFYAGGIEEWLEDGVTGLAVPPNNRRAFAESIDRLVGEPDLAARLGRAGKAAYESKFRPEHHVTRLIEVFEQITAGGTRSDVRQDAASIAT